jgi:pyrroline-5-carboxylate reductase
LSDHKSITFIGAGNMARSLIRGLLASGYPASAITASDPVAGQRAELTAAGIHCLQDNSEACRDADVIVLAVKPQILGDVLGGIDNLRPDQLLISIAAGVPIASLCAWSCPEQAIVRCMPNTPALLGAGITGLYPNSQVSGEQRATAAAILNAAGRTLWVEREDLLDAVTAVSGSGPAYFFYLMEAMIRSGIQLGLDADTARELTIETAYGAALMARDGSDEPSQLRSNVTSPGGTTERALSILDAAGVSDTVLAALTGARDRSQELAKEFGQS